MEKRKSSKMPGMKLTNQGQKKEKPSGKMPQGGGAGKQGGSKMNGGSCSGKMS